MIVTLIKHQKISGIVLPEKVSGQYSLKDTDALGSRTEFLNIEGIGGKWIMKSNKAVHILDHENRPVKNIVLEPLNVYNLEIAGFDYKACVFTEPVTQRRQMFTKVFAGSDDTRIAIGRNESNDIVFSSGFVSASHARLAYHKGKWKVIDNDSTNGTFVNEQRAAEKELRPGDVVFIMGLKIVIGSKFIAYNNPDDKIRLNTNRLLPYEKQTANAVSDEEETEPRQYFYRSPRFKRDIETSVFKLDSPTQNPIGDEFPLMLLIGPSMTMGLASLTTGVFAINNAMAGGNISAAVPSIAMSFSMLLGTVMWPVVSKGYEKKRKRKKEALRQEKYKAYLNEMKAKIIDECARQTEILHENHITVAECSDRIKLLRPNLWERGFGQNDFLKLRAGLGSQKLDAEFAYPERRFTIDRDNLQEELYRLCETPKVLNNIPVTLSLFENYICGIIGNRKLTKEFARGIILQLAALYSYDEVKLLFLFDEEESKEFEFAKWLPHVWNNENNFRLIATNSHEIKEVSAYLEKEIEVRAEISEQDMKEAAPYYIIFSFSQKLAKRAEMLKQIYAEDKNMHISVLSIFDEFKSLPKECTAVVELERNSGKIYNKNDISGQYVKFSPDILIADNLLDLSVRLANIQLDKLEDSSKLPSMMTFLEMYDVGKVEHLNALERWKENDPAVSLEAPVGVNTIGDALRLDLHEKFHGPHGLIAGMTGSGKSEFIMTYILSLAVNYHPHELAFILIDYKGGGMAKAFESLPHTAGIITNLDGAAVKRSLISIESELRRRQAIFAEVSKIIGVSNIDIYKYQRLYREGKVEEPLQHLLIISDEFAELKTQQPEFMAQLISAARIGRSLGVHLILATQKPSGVVDDQIWSNSRFRVCLKVQERSDSMDMLKRPDAAELSQTGRFYLQVGYNELFEVGQSAWAGAPYYPAEKAVREKDDSVVVIDNNGRVLKQVKIDKKKSLLKNPKKQLDAVTEYLSNIAKEESIAVRPLWLEPIPALIYLSGLKQKYGTQGADGLNPVIGEYDDPERQRQCLLRLPVSEGNLVVCGGAGSGKTTFLTTMLYSLITEYPPAGVNIYILDFASETLKAFAKAPHVGDVMLSYESEKISNLFKLLYGEVERRKKMFAGLGGDYDSFISSAEEKVPVIVVVINNFAAFTEIYEEKEEAVSFLAREGTKYGIYFVLSATGTGAVRFRLLQNFKQQIALQLNDQADYSTILGKTDGLLPSRLKGRGLIKTDKLYEFQTAHVTDEKNPFQFIAKKCAQLQAEYHGKTAKKIPVLPEKVDVEFLSDYLTARDSFNIPVGVEKNSLEVCYYPFDAGYITLAASSGTEYLDFEAALIQLLAQSLQHKLTVFDTVSALVGAAEEGAIYHSQVKDAESAIDKLFYQIAERNNQYKEAIENQQEPKAFEPIIIIFNAFSQLRDAIDGVAQEKLAIMLEKGEAKYGVSILIFDSVKNLQGAAYEKWFKKHLTQADGIWLGNGITEQYILKAVKNTSGMYEDLEEGFGFVLKKGKAVKVKLLKEDWYG